MLHRQLAAPQQHHIRSLLSRCYSLSACRCQRKRAPPYRPGELVVMRAADDDVRNRYRSYSRKELLGRIAALEQVKGQGSSSGTSADREQSTADDKDSATTTTRKQRRRVFDIKRYPCRKIALRFSYDGEAYCGLEMQSAEASSDGEAVPTVEAALWKALSDARLVDEAEGLHGVGWSRCGRTDRGVSSAGQVVALWIRSRKVDQWPLRRAMEKMKASGQDRVLDVNGELPTFQERRLQKEAKVQELARSEADSTEAQQVDDDETADKRVHADPDADELPYIKTLHSILPPSIRIHAWSPVSPAFDARFDCRYRHYKYFFTGGAPFVKQALVHGPVPRLNIELMRSAAQRFLGEHDFRNFCKIDPSKVITNFYRRIDGIAIDRVGRRWTRGPDKDDGDDDDDAEDMYVLNLRGSAFLYHQVRHIMAVLFLVGARLEKPCIIDELLNVKPGGVHNDRIVSAKLNGLRLSDNGTPLTELPPPTDAAATEAAGGLIGHYHRMRLDTTAIDAESSAMSQEDGQALAPLRDLFVFDRRPLYDMAMDRPLMLWECGFDESDVQWRASQYDGPMDGAALDSAESAHEEAPTNDSPTPFTRAMLYSIWNAHSITTELYRHFALALPPHGSANASSSRAHSHGYLPSTTTFRDARHPAMQSTATALANGDASPSKLTRNLIPLGYGTFKSKPVHGPLRNAHRMATPEERYEHFQESRGRRKAERKAAVAAVDAVTEQ